ncbi:MAG: Y-family DNA polymerase, partial [Limisphaerales bacterium]
GRLCPKGIFIYPRMSYYREESRRIMEILARTGALLEPMSIDEAYLDVTTVLPATPAMLEEEPALKLAREIKGEILRQRDLTATIGIAPNKLLAKLASDFKKPNGLTLIPERDKVLFLRPLPVRAIHGVGNVTEQVLKGVGILTIADLQDYTGDLRKLVGSFAPVLKRYAFGEDDRPLETEWETKSISNEETFDTDTDDRRILRATLRQQSEEIASELQEKKLGAYTIQVKVRYSDFTTLTRQVTVEEATSEPNEIYRLGCYLLARDRLVNRPLRLLGLGVSGLTEPVWKQLTFF